MRIPLPQPQRQLHPQHRLLLPPLGRARTTTAVHAGRVDPHEADAVEREPDRGAVAVDEPVALEGVADDGEVGWPGGVVVVEGGEGEEDVGVGV